jgi:hypothetical protein
MKLSPSQERAVEGLRANWSAGDVFALWAPCGLGRTTMLRAVHEERGGVILGMAAYLDRLTGDIGEVQDVDLSALRGVDDIVRALEANIILPLEDDTLATHPGSATSRPGREAHCRPRPRRPRTHLAEGRREPGAHHAIVVGDERSWWRATCLCAIHPTPPRLRN